MGSAVLRAVAIFANGALALFSLLCFQIASSAEFVPLLHCGILFLITAGVSIAALIPRPRGGWRTTLNWLSAVFQLATITVGALFVAPQVIIGGRLEIGLLLHASPVFLSPPITLIGIFIIRPRHPAHCCRQCGYDLSGSSHGRCSECGKPLPQRARATT